VAATAAARRECPCRRLLIGSQEYISVNNPTTQQDTKSTVGTTNWGTLGFPLIQSFVSHIAFRQSLACIRSLHLQSKARFVSLLATAAGMAECPYRHMCNASKDASSVVPLTPVFRHLPQVKKVVRLTKPSAPTPSALPSALALTPVFSTFHTAPGQEGSAPCVYPPPPIVPSPAPCHPRQCHLLWP
jgi:hypothetical protein